MEYIKLNRIAMCFMCRHDHVTFYSSIISKMPSAVVTALSVASSSGCRYVYCIGMHKPFNFRTITITMIIIVKRVQTPKGCQLSDTNRHPRPHITSRQTEQRSNWTRDGRWSMAEGRGSRTMDIGHGWPHAYSASACTASIGTRIPTLSL